MKSKQDTSVNIEELISSIQTVKLCNYQFEYQKIETEFNWKYCQGSIAYKRGYTCSLWLLIHTILINAEDISFHSENVLEHPAYLIFN